MKSPRPWAVTGSDTTVRIVDANGKTVCTMKRRGENDLDNAHHIVNCVNFGRHWLNLREHHEPR